MACKYYVQSWKGITPDMEQNDDQPSAPKVKDLSLTEELGEAAVVIITNVFHSPYVGHVLMEHHGLVGRTMTDPVIEKWCPCQGNTFQMFD